MFLRLKESIRRLSHKPNLPEAVVAIDDYRDRQEKISSVEKMIDEVGRDEVFAHARSLGWSPANTPPIWLWGMICAEVEQNKRRRNERSSSQ